MQKTNDHSYFPQITGNWIKYDVREINIDSPSNLYDTSNYQLKDVTSDAFADNSGDTCYRIERYQRVNDTMPWIIKKVFVTKIKDNSAIWTEDNITQIKIKFPAEINNSWDGNVYDTLGSQIFKITEVDKKENINSLDFDSVLTVIQRDEENLIEKYYTAEKYGKRKGLIYKEDIKITSMNIVPGEPYYKRIRTGTILIQQVSDMGHK